MATAIDEAVGLSEARYSLTRVYRTPVTNRTVRVRIVRDVYPAQSDALAEVLTDALTWTHLATEPPSGWHGDTRVLGGAMLTTERVTAALNPLADWLYQRAIGILG